MQEARGQQRKGFCREARDPRSHTPCPLNPTDPQQRNTQRADAAAAAGLPTLGARGGGSASSGSNDVLELGFEFRKLRFIYHAETGAFARLKYPVHEPLESYLKATGYGSSERVAAAMEIWGDNRFEVPVPPFGALLKEQVLAPFFVFQVFCVGLWCLDEYWCGRARARARSSLREGVS